MEKIELNDKNELAIIKQACTLLQHGGVVVYPTDTLYGLGADARNEEGIKRLFMIKKRPKNKPLPIFVDSITMAKKYACIDKNQERILEKVWPIARRTSTSDSVALGHGRVGPGAVTIILEKKQTISLLVSGGQKTVGLRIPDSPFCLHLIHALGGPIVGTSANISGEAGSNSLAPIMKQFTAHSRFPDLIIDGGTLPDSPASTIIDCTKSKPKLVRMGPVSAKDLKKILAL